VDVITTVADARDIDTVACLAREIWYEHYVPIIGLAQVDYMVARIQGVAAITDQVRSGLEYFLLWAAGEAAGYFAVQAEPATAQMFISKFYIRKELRGRRLAVTALLYIESLCRARGLVRLWLTVNKFNPALEVYKRLGFVITQDVVTDIGGGFVMDDFRMEKPVG
jgi:GNAT superfamily N-acetyltransferase